MASSLSYPFLDPAPASRDRAGIYYLNTTDLPSRNAHLLASITLHETVPGHHLHFALQAELTSLPQFRRSKSWAQSTQAFNEGWALYSEKLGLEMGMYANPFDNIGRLMNELWRAIRLVLDTGIHNGGWSREDAIRYAEVNSGLSTKEIEDEVDRFIVQSAQALAYKVGEIYVLDMRRWAEDELGKAFDIRRFHDALMANGSLPLSSLGQVMDEWVIAEQSRHGIPRE